ncbi:Tetratricopeptide repeat protein [Pelagimonas phthalicica]|uniref:Tetratricopeptide repeat protein n=1 Tax=Pelagimonas phthalicica TaxID=1037362 RepID=A0A238JC69_9RHOB|nr:MULTISPECIES: tetratricopeptide repeat protein [Roseobacteraceae]MBO9465236.1 tetratricopeptide repeat protein [Tropicibacter sp. R15_0]TDS93914.1 tetratricopeptide repeat protein [Pelagimonas phthalicica]SMX27562.1 Tetratricopeptide repeat protein [Pelagimonas phthalicica]
MHLAPLGAVLILSFLAACSTGGQDASLDTPFAPALDPKGEAVDGLIVGHRLMDAGQHELALNAFTRAAGEHGLTGEVLMALGTANLALGRLNQAENQLRDAVKKEPDWPEAWNNLGVLLIEKGELPEAVEVLRRAFALDNGESDAIRDNLRLAIEKMENSVYGADTEYEYTLVRRGRGQFTIRSAPAQ